jgi:hypothetical protein
LITLYLDAGENCGGALANGRQLFWCGLLSLSDHWILGFPYTQQTDRLVIEIPNAHESKGKTRSKRDPQAIITLAITCGQWIRHVSAKDTIRKFPSTWKGQVPKDLHNTRVLEALTDPERELVASCGAAKSKLNNVVDAVGLFLDDTGRMQRGRTVA